MSTLRGRGTLLLQYFISNSVNLLGALAHTHTHASTHTHTVYNLNESNTFKSLKHKTSCTIPYTHAKQNADSVWRTENLFVLYNINLNFQSSNPYPFCAKILDQNLLFFFLRIVCQLNLFLFLMITLSTSSQNFLEFNWQIPASNYICLAFFLFRSMLFIFPIRKVFRNQHFHLIMKLIFRWNLKGFFLSW